MKFSIEIKELAKKGAIEAFLYYESQQKQLGERFLDKMELVLNGISNHPKLYPEKYKSFRQALIKPFPYLIIFEIIDQSIIVYKVVFAKRHPDKLYK
jgi:hypothetical protein